jgi:glyoxylase I family protein
MPPFAIKKFDHLVLRTEDVEKSIEFYVDILGCSVDRRRPELGLYHLRCADFLIDLIDVNGSLGGNRPAVSQDMPRNLDHICLIIDPFDGAALTEFLKSKEITASTPEPRYGADGVAASLYFDDPDGNTIELKSPDCQELL